MRKSICLGAILVVVCIFASCKPISLNEEPRGDDKVRVSGGPRIMEDRAKKATWCKVKQDGKCGSMIRLMPRFLLGRIEIEGVKSVSGKNILLEGEYLISFLDEHGNVLAYLAHENYNQAEWCNLRINRCIKRSPRFQVQEIEITKGPNAVNNNGSVTLTFAQSDEYEIDFR